MKKTSISIGVIASLCIASASYAATPQNGQICLHQSAKMSSKCIKKININTPLVSIIKKEKWVKVGLKDKNGTVGWVYKPDYRKAEKQFYQPDIQTVYIQKERKKNGKMTYNVVAYKNGKKVTDEQAKVMYNKIRKEQIRENKTAQRIDNNIRNGFLRQFDMMNRMFDQNNRMMFRMEDFNHTLPDINKPHKLKKQEEHPA